MENDCLESFKFKIAPDPFTAIQNVPQVLTTAGGDVVFNLSKKNKYAKLSKDGTKIIMRKKGDFVISASGGALLPLLALTKISVILLKNCVPVLDTLNVFEGIGTVSTNSFSKNLRLKKKDKLELYIETDSVSTISTFVPSISVNNVLVSGNGITLQVQPIATSDGYVIIKPDINATSVEPVLNNEGEVVFFRLSEPDSENFGTPMEIAFALSSGDSGPIDPTPYFLKHGSNIKLEAYVYNNADNESEQYARNFVLHSVVNGDERLMITVPNETYNINDPQYNIPSSI